MPIYGLPGIVRSKGKRYRVPPKEKFKPLKMSDLQLKDVINRQVVSNDGSVTYHFTRTRNGLRFGLAKAFTAPEMELRGYVAQELIAARAELYAAMAAQSVNLQAPQTVLVAPAQQAA